MTIEAKYYQYQKDLNYPAFVRFESKETEDKFKPLLEILGFTELEKSELKTISFSSGETKVLRIQEASPKVAKQIDESHSSDKYGPENITPLGSYNVYRYKNVGMLIFGDGNYIWELGVKGIENHQNEIKTMMVRFLSWALAPKGIVSFWSVPVDTGIVVMKPIESQFEAVFIDMKKNLYITQDGVKEISPGFQVLRLDESLKGRTRKMSKEELISFLCTKTCYFSYQGLDFRLRQSVFEFAKVAEGCIHPVDSYNPRFSGKEAA